MYETYLAVTTQINISPLLRGFGSNSQDPYFSFLCDSYFIEEDGIIYNIHSHG